METGLTEGYAVAGLENDNDGGYWPHRGDWIETADGKWGLLLDRETMRAWRWPARFINLEATSEEHLLFSQGTLLLVTNRLMEEIARFSVGVAVSPRSAIFSPDGSAVVFEAANKVYLVPVATGRPVVLFDPPLYHGEHGDLRLLWTGVHSRRLPPLGISWASYDGGPGIFVTAGYRRPEPDPKHRETEEQFTPSAKVPVARVTERRYFSWEGEALPAPACPGILSPDGRYKAVQDGGPYPLKYADIQPSESRWPSVVVTDAETCDPIFRVHPAYTYTLSWSASWLPTGAGLVVGVSGGFAIVRVGAAPSLTPLPLWDRYLDGPGPDPAPTEGDRYFGYSHRVYDAEEDRWYGPSGSEAPDLDGGMFWWGASHRERWFHSWIYRGESSIGWDLLPPKIEFPPFGKEGIAFRVARTGSCLRLREELGEEGRVLHCLPDGERLLYAGGAGPLRVAHIEWVYVRTEDGAEGWVSARYLDRD